MSPGVREQTSVCYGPHGGAATAGSEDLQAENARLWGLLQERGAALVVLRRQAAALQVRPPAVGAAPMHLLRYCDVVCTFLAAPVESVSERLSLQAALNDATATVLHGAGAEPAAPSSSPPHTPLRVRLRDAELHSARLQDQLAARERLLADMHGSAAPTSATVSSLARPSAGATFGSSHAAGWPSAGRAPGSADSARRSLALGDAEGSPWTLSCASVASPASGRGATFATLVCSCCYERASEVRCRLICARCCARRAQPNHGANSRRSSVHKGWVVLSWTSHVCLRIRTIVPACSTCVLAHTAGPAKTA